MKRKSQEYHLILPERYKPSLSEMVLVFTIASIVGYFVETGYVFLSVGKVVKRGMLIGPYCPIYGFGALILYLCFYRVTAKKGNIPLIFISASLILGSFELLCGLAFKYILNIEMWNYYGKPLNIGTSTGSPILILCGNSQDANGNNSFENSNIVLYSALLFNRDLTTDEINWVKTNLIESEQ